MAAWSDMAREAYAGRLELKPGARDFLLRCAQAGKPMAVLTSCMPHLCRAALEHHGLMGLFQEVFTTAGLGLEKGDPALYRLAARRCGLPPEEYQALARWDIPACMGLAEMFTSQRQQGISRLLAEIEEQTKLREETTETGKRGTQVC